MTIPPWEMRERAQRIATLRDGWWWRAVAWVRDALRKGGGTISP